MSINERIYELRSANGPLSGNRPWRTRAREIIMKEFGVDLTEQAIRKRFQRESKRVASSTGTPERRGKSFTQTDNTAIASYVGDRIVTIEQLLALCEVDLEIWAVEKVLVNKWEVAARSETKDLSWKNGILNGSVETDGGLTVQDLIQVKAWLTRRIPEKTSWPIVKPVVVEFTPAKIVGSRRNELQTALVFGDAHICFFDKVPSHSDAAMNIVVNVARDIRPNVIVMLGDMLDLPEWTDRFMRTPDMYFSTQMSLIRLSSFLADLADASPGSEIVYIAGNHEHRMPAAISRNALAAYNLKQANNMYGPPIMSIRHLLDLDRLGVQYIEGYPDGVYWLNDNLCCEHGNIARAGSGDTTKAVIKETRNSVILGHIHRLECASKTVHTRYGEVTYKIMSPGALCRIDGAVPARSKRNNWQKGFAVIQYYNGDEIFTDTLVSIHKDRAIYNGVEYIA